MDTKRQLEPVPPAARAQQAAPRQGRIPRLAGEEGERESKKLGDIRTTASFIGADFIKQGSCVWPGAQGN